MGSHMLEFSSEGFIYRVNIFYFMFLYYVFALCQV